MVGESLKDYFNAVLGLCNKMNRDMDDDDVILRLLCLNSGILCANTFNRARFMTEH